MEEIKTIENQYSEIAKEIDLMFDEDQAMRLRAKENNWVIESEEDDKLDYVNTEKMKKIVSQIGWPSASKVGKDTAYHAWLLVQHSDHDVDFQSHCLSLMLELPSGEVELEDIAHLTDRICVNKGEPQIYGTQYRDENEHSVPKEIKDIESVDERRRSMGMDTLEENIQRMNEKYHSK